MVASVLFVFARPSDETLFSASAIATLVDSGARVTVLVCTAPREGDHAGDDPRAQGAKRSSEYAAALAALGVEHHLLLGETGARWLGKEPRVYSDSASWLPGSASAEHPQALDLRALLVADPGEVAADIAAAIMATEPDVVVTYSATGSGGDPVRVRVHETTRTAAHVLEVALYIVGSARGAVDSVSAAPTLARKRAAVQAYESRLQLRGDTIIVSPHVSMPLTAPETYRRLRPAGTSFFDFGRLTRLFTGALALVVGVLTGAVLTVAHQGTVAVGSATVPWGIIVALAIAGALLVGLRLVFQTRIVVGVAAVGILGAASFLALQSSGGSVLVPDNTVGHVWLYGSVVLTALVLAWPQLPSRAHGNIEGSSAKGSVSP